MELHEFVPKFLTDYEKGLSDYKRIYYRDEPIKFEKEGERKFNLLHFPEALQNYTNIVCQKQRENCLNMYYKGILDKNVLVPKFANIYDDILNAEQPKIEDL
jgi:hypothetical protein